LQVVESLIAQRGIPRDQLSRERLRLRDAVSRKIKEHREKAMRAAYQEMVFGDSAIAIEVSPKCAFDFDTKIYPVRDVYAGVYEFKKHFHRAIGTMNDEEAQCAFELDRRPKVKYWVRNLERQPVYSFSLQTPTDRFYPDFVALLEDGRTLVVEYKGSHLLTSQDTKEKQAIGEMWEMNSKGKCVFLMVSKEDFQSRLRSVAG
jgi:type III restriction enzyme